MTRRQIVCYWAPPIVWAGLILVGTSLPRAPGPDVVGFDKVSHFFAYGVLGLLLMRSLLRCRCQAPHRAALLTLAVGAVFAAVDELHQSWIPGRHTDILDFAADCVGLALAIAAMWTFRRHKTHTHNAGSVDHAQTVTNEEMTIMAEVLHLDQDSFASEVLNAETPALVDFWAPWCGPCQMMGPTIDKLAGDYAGKAVIAKVNVDVNPDLASKYGIRSIPALMLFKGGEVVDQLVGVQSEATLKQKLDALV